MTFPMQISFVGIESSEAIDLLLREKFGKLSTYSDRITGCRIVIETPHRHQTHGKPYAIRVVLDVPGENIVVNCEAADGAPYRDIRAAIREAYLSTRRLLEDYARRRRGEVKTHAETNIGAAL